MSEYIKLNNTWVEVKNVYKKINGVWTQQTNINSCMSQSSIYYYNSKQIDGNINPLTIECPNTITGTSANVIARYNSTIITPTWSITSGNSCASIDNTGAITIIDSGNITIQAIYNDFTTTKDISVVYDANTETEITIDENGSIITETTTTLVDSETGATTTTITSTTVNEDGSSSSTEIETIENQDGSSSISTTTINYDEYGNTTGSVKNETTNNADGSSQSVTTNYDANGDPTDKVNEDIDISGNIDTQNIEYNSNGDEVVVGYTIDTTNNQNGYKEITGNGVDTDFIPFDGSSGFELIIKFKAIQTEQPNPPIVTDTEDNSSNFLFNIMCAKGASSPYSGIDIRWVIPKSDYSSSSAKLVARYQGRSKTEVPIIIITLFNFQQITTPSTMQTPIQA